MAEMMTVEEVAARWQMGTAWVRHMCETGTLPAQQTADGWLVDPRDVREYEAKQHDRPDVYSPEDSQEPPTGINPG